MQDRGHLQQGSRTYRALEFFYKPLQSVCDSSRTAEDWFESCVSVCKLRPVERPLAREIALIADQPTLTNIQHTVTLDLNDDRGFYRLKSP